MRLLDLRAAAAAVGRAPFAPPVQMQRKRLQHRSQPGDWATVGWATFGGGEGDPWTVDLALAVSGLARGGAPLDMARCRICTKLGGPGRSWQQTNSALWSFPTVLIGSSPALVPNRTPPPSRFAVPGVSAFSAPSNGLAKLVDADPIQREQGDGATLLTFQWRCQKPDARWQRRVFLSGDGKDLRGEDAAVASPNSPAMLAFHLHTGSDAIALDDGGILIRARSGQGWRFRSDRPARLAAEPYRGRPGQPAASARIELPLTVGPSGTEQVRWSLRMEPQRG